MTSSKKLLGSSWSTRFLTAALVLTAAVLGWFVMPEVTLAQGLLPACAEAGDCTLCDVVGVFINFAALITQWLGILAVLMFIIGGVFIIIAGGNPDRVKRGRQIIGGTLIGSVLVMTGWLIVNFALAALLNADFDDVEIFPTVSDTGASTGGGETWYELACTPVYVDCSGAQDGQSCQDSTCEQNCVCSTGTCVTLCDYKQITGTYSSTHCESSSSSCSSSETSVSNWCDLDAAGSSQVCCVSI